MVSTTYWSHISSVIKLGSMYAFGEDFFGLSDVTLSAHFDCWFARAGEQRTGFMLSVVSIAL